MKRAAHWGLVASLLALGACASTVDGATTAGDAGADAATPGACAQWVLTDREEGSDGEIYTDLHLTFDPANQLQERREHIRTGGHGKNRTYREFTYQWSPTGLTVTQVGAASERAVYTLDGANLVARANESMNAGLRRSVRYTRDATGRVVERVETREGPAEPNRCGYDYDPAGHLVQVACSDGELARYQWEGDRPVRRDRSFRGRNPGFDVWQWSAAGALVSERHDDGYGPGREYRYDHTYDAEGRLLRTESTLGSPPARRPVAAFAYDAQGRLTREERGFDESGAAQSVVRWERDAEGRIARRIAGDGTAALTYAYAVSPGQVEVTTTSGTWRGWRRYRCFATPVRVEPAEPTPGVRIASVSPQVEEFPAAPLEP
jgi:YD repeat-containing protein